MRTNEEYFKVAEETVKFYSEDVNRRAARINEEGDNECLYLAPSGNMCAVGRCLIDPSTAPEGYSAASIGDEKFKPEYKGFSREFWQDLQALHDGEKNWNKEGLTSTGKESFGEIMLNISLEKYE